MDSNSKTSSAKIVDPYSALGGHDTCRKLSEALYRRIAKDPELKPLFPGKSLRCATEAFGSYLVQFLGGPHEDGERLWWLSLEESHRRFQIGRRERDAWMRNMVSALDDVELSDSSRAALREFFERASTHLINSGEREQADSFEKAACVVNTVGGALSERWGIQLEHDALVAMIVKGESEQAIALTDSLLARGVFERDRRPFLGILALMIGVNDSLSSYVQKTVLGDPTLVNERYSGRTLLHWACGKGNIKIVELLLQLGADANASSEGGKTPLYCLANECKEAGTGEIVHMLVKCGALVDANENYKHCTPLHMAARRGNVDVAGALLDCAANIEARDSLGDTPLRRAVSCNQVEVAKLLLSRGADKNSKGSKSMTPKQAARTKAMKQLFDV